jgi:hypothetical protein
VGHVKPVEFETELRHAASARLVPVDCPAIWRSSGVARKGLLTLVNDNIPAHFLHFVYFSRYFLEHEMQ